MLRGFFCFFFFVLFWFLFFVFRYFFGSSFFFFHSNFFLPLFIIERSAFLFFSFFAHFFLDPYLIEHDWRCQKCQHTINKLTIENRLIDIVKKRSIGYQVQDLGKNQKDKNTKREKAKRRMKPKQSKKKKRKADATFNKLTIENRLIDIVKKTKYRLSSARFGRKKRKKKRPREGKKGKQGKISLYICQFSFFPSFISSCS